MQPLVEDLIKILAELIVFTLLNLLPMRRRLKRIDGRLTRIQRTLRRVPDLVRRLDRHDELLHEDTRRPPLRVRRPDAPA